MAKMHSLRDIFHFLSVEEQNLLKSTVNLKADVDFITALDSLYFKCHKEASIEDKQRIPAFLFFVTHAEFYSSIGSFLRLHRSQAFRSLRSAIDSTLTAYYLLKKPSDTDLYLSALGEKYDASKWKKFQFIKKTIKQRISSFPLAKSLPVYHETCSKFAHADPIGIIHRLEIDLDGATPTLEARYFDYDVSLYAKWLYFICNGYFLLLNIYWQELFKPLYKKESIDLIEKKMKLYSDKIGGKYFDFLSK